MTTEEGNKLIAEFDGKKFKAYKDNSSYVVEFDTYAECEEWIIKNQFEGYTPCIAWKQGVGKYHSSWDWLMPVVEKINGMAFDDVGEVGVVIYPGTTNVETVNDELLIEGFSQKEYILNTWHTVVEFIKWYNQNQQKGGIQ